MLEAVVPPTAPRLLSEQTWPPCSWIEMVVQDWNKVTREQSIQGYVSVDTRSNVKMGGRRLELNQVLEMLCQGAPRAGNPGSRSKNPAVT